MDKSTNSQWEIHSSLYFKEPYYCDVVLKYYYLVNIMTIMRSRYISVFCGEELLIVWKQNKGPSLALVSLRVLLTYKNCLKHLRVNGFDMSPRWVSRNSLLACKTILNPSSISFIMAFIKSVESKFLPGSILSAA